MRPWILLAALAALTPACKKHPQSTLPIKPGCNVLPSGGNQVTPEATQFHVYLRCPDQMGAVRTFYQRELVEKRGWQAQGTVFTLGDNLTHVGIFGPSGAATVKDPSQPGGWVALEELPNSIDVDLWENVPAPR